MPGRRRPDWSDREDVAAGLEGDAAPQQEADQPDAAAQQSGGGEGE